MPLVAPNLDDRRFADLVEEAKSLIPRYTPEWTDHNLSDPGITMIQLFAWLSDIVIYRLNRVPERQYIKFLQLIGVELKPAMPARAEITFTLSNPNVGTVIIPQGTRIATEAKPTPPSAASAGALQPEDEEPVVFETDEPLIAIGAALKRVQVYDGMAYVERTTANDPLTEAYYPFGKLARDESALLIGFSSVNLFPTEELNLTVRAYTDPDSITEHSCDGSVLVPSGTVVWEYWNGSEWRRLDVVKDDTASLTASGHLYFNGPKDIVRATVGTVTDEQLYWIRCRLRSGSFERAPQIEAVLVNTVSATAVATARDEVVGSSNGSPAQLMTLRHAPVYAKPPRATDERLLEMSKTPANPTESERAALDEKLRVRESLKGFLLEVDESGTMRPWEEVEDFYTSEPGDRHYTMNRTTGEIRFGDGKRGRIPIAGINNIVARYYRYGGGAAGNVGTGTVTDLQSSVNGVDAATNNWPAEGGADEELVEDAKTRAPKELKARDRAVTVQDFEFLALEAPGARVRRAHALPLYHPQFPGVQVPGVITVMIVPDSDDPKPVPSEGTMETVCAYLNDRRLLTTELYVAPPKYRLVRVEASVTARPTANIATVKSTIASQLAAYLHPLTGGADGQGWPLGGPVLYSEIFRVVLQVEGVQIVNRVRITIDGDPIGECKNVEIPSDYLVYSDGHDVTVSYSTN